MTGAGQALPRAPVPAARVAGTVLAVLAVTIAVAALPGWTGLTLLAWPLLVVACYRHPAFGVALLAFTVPLQHDIWIETIAGYSTVTRYVGWALIIAWVLMVAKGARGVIDGVAVTHALVVITLVVSFAAGEVRAFAWFMETYHWLLPLLIYVVCRSLQLSDRDRLWIVAGISAGVIVTSVVAIQQFLTGAGPTSFEVGGAVRVFGTFGHPNTLAVYLVLALPLMIATAVLWPSPSPSLAIWIVRAGSVAGTATLILTQSRGGWLALAGAVAVLVLLAPRTVQRATVIVVAVVILAGVASGLATEIPGVARFSSVVHAQFNRVQVTTETWGQLERQAHWGAAASMMKENPLFGVGAGEYNASYREYTPEWRYRVGRGQAHNGFLHMGAQAGVPGMLAFVVWVGTILVALARRIPRSMGPGLAIMAGATATLIAYVVHSMFEYLAVLSLPVLLSIVIALAIGTDLDSRERERSGTRRMAGNAS